MNKMDRAGWGDNINKDKSIEQAEENVTEKQLNKQFVHRTVYQPPNHLAGVRFRKTVLGLRSSASSVIISTAVVRGLEGVADWLAGSGVGNAAKRVLAGGGTVTVCV